MSALPRIPERLLDGNAVGCSSRCSRCCTSSWAMPPYWAHALRAVFALQRRGLLSVSGRPVRRRCSRCWRCRSGSRGALLPLIFDRLRREMWRTSGQVAGRLYALEHRRIAARRAARRLHPVLLARPAPRLPRRTGGARARCGDPRPADRAALRAGTWRASCSCPRGWCSVAAAGLESRAARRRPVPQPRVRWPTPSSGPKRSSVNTAPSLVFYDDDPNSTVSVLHYSDGKGTNTDSHRGQRQSRTETWSATTSRCRLAALLPALMADSHERCFVIGFGTGVTAGELAALEETRSVDVAEISRGVIAAAPIFDYGNQGASKNPKVTVHRGDAYRTLLQDGGPLRRDRLGAEQPVGGGRRDALQPRVPRGGARSRLPPGRRLRPVVARSTRSTQRDRGARAAHLRVGVPRMSRCGSTQSRDLLLLGFARPEARARRRGTPGARFRRPDFAAGFAARGRSTSFPALLAHELLPLGTLRAAAEDRARSTPCATRS